MRPRQWGRLRASMPVLLTRMSMPRREDRLDAGGPRKRNGGGPLMMIVIHALLAFVLAANAVVAFAAISKVEEPRRER